jgi:hypothetical protein
MPSRVVGVRLPVHIHTVLLNFCVAQGQQPGAVMRLLVRDLLAHPERWPDLLAAQPGYVLQEQEAVLRTWQQAVEEPEPFDIAAHLEALRVVPFDLT